MPCSLADKAHYGRMHGADTKQDYTHITLLQKANININYQEVRYAAVDWIQMALDRD
jgi:hypothetical protein